MRYHTWAWLFIASLCFISWTWAISTTILRDRIITNSDSSLTSVSTCWTARPVFCPIIPSTINYNVLKTLVAKVYFSIILLISLTLNWLTRLHMIMFWGLTWLTLSLYQDTLIVDVFFKKDGSNWIIITIFIMKLQYNSSYLQMPLYLENNININKM